MTYKTVEIPVVGPTDQVQSRDLDHQLSQNYYAYPSEVGVALQGTPGGSLFSEFANAAPDRGFHVFNNILYQVSGNTLERVNANGTRDDLGTITGEGRCIFADDGTEMFTVANGNVWRFNTALSQSADPDFESPKGVAYLNRQFIYDGNGHRWVSSEVGDGGDIRSDNYAEAESNPDDMTIPYTFEEKLYLFGEETIEPWWNSGVGAPPFQIVNTAVIQKGTKSPYSVCNTDKFIYFLADDLNVYQLRGNQTRSISNQGFAEAVNKISRENGVSDAIGFCFNLKGANFYYITFPAGNKSFLYSQGANQWTSMSFGVNGDRHLASSYAFVYGKHLIADHRTGRILEWDWDLNEDNGEVIQRRRVYPPFTSKTLGLPAGKRLQMNRVEIEMATGLGTAAGAGFDPEIDIEISTDSGHSFETLNTVSIGQAGEFDLKVEAYHTKTFRRATVRTTQTSPVLSSMTAAAIDVKLAGF